MPKSAPLRTADVASLLGCSPDAVQRNAAALGLGRREGRGLVFRRPEVAKLRKAIGKRGWRPGRSRRGQGAGRRWTAEQRAHYAATIAARRRENA